MDGKERSPILVTGASGFIGRALVAHLHERGRPAIAVARRPFDAPAGVTALVAAGDPARDRTLRDALAQTDCIVHLAGRAHHGGTDADFAPDVELTHALACLAVQAGVRRLILMSSIGVVGTRSAGAPFTEDTMPMPTEPYARGKLRSEQALQQELCAQAHTQWVILRPPMVYGPAAPGNFARLVQAVQRRWPLPFASVHNRRSLVGITNLLAAIVLCIDHPAAARQVFLIADEAPVSTPELIALIAQGLQVAPRLFPVAPGLMKMLARATNRSRFADSLLADLEVDTAKLRQVLGWRSLVGPAEGIVHAAATFRP
jgi:nucleoside-diphosphate-sugar epimerase